MRRKKRQNKITEKRNIQKEICRIPLLFLVLLSVMCTGSLTAADFNIDVLLLSHSLTTFAFSVPNGGVIIHGTPSLILLTTMR